MGEGFVPVLQPHKTESLHRPVGLCALINAVDYKPKNLLAVDSVQSRLDLAKSLGAEPWNFQTDREGLDKRVKELTDGRGADVVIGTRLSDARVPCVLLTELPEVVGLSPALKMGFELLRPWGNRSWPHFCRLY